MAGLSSFPTSLDSITNRTDNVDDALAAHVNLLNDAVESIEAKLGIDSSAVVTSIEYILKNASSSNPGHKHTLATGATDVTATAAKLNAVGALHDQKIWVYANTAPTGWNIVASTTDALIACKGGSNAYNTTGGQQIGTWTQPNHTHTGPNHTHTGPNHTHTGPSHTHTGPSHTHSISRDGWGNTGGDAAGRLATYYNCVDSNLVTGAAGTGATGAGGTGATGASGTAATGAGGTGATGGGATAAAYRPLSNLGIIIEKT